MSKKIKTIIIIAIVAVSIFALVSLYWVLFYFLRVKPNIDIAKEIEQGNMAAVSFVESFEDEGTTYYSWYDDTANYNINTPPFLKFRFGFQALTTLKYDKDFKLEDPYVYDLRYNVKTLWENAEYRVIVEDYSNVPAPETIDDGSVNFSGEPENYDLVFDENMNLIDGDKEIYSKHKDRIEKLYDACKKYIAK